MPTKVCSFLSSSSSSFTDSKEEVWHLLPRNCKSNMATCWFEQRDDLWVSALIFVGVGCRASGHVQQRVVTHRLPPATSCHHKCHSFVWENCRAKKARSTHIWNVASGYGQKTSVMSSQYVAALMGEMTVDRPSGCCSGESMLPARQRALASLGPAPLAALPSLSWRRHTEKQALAPASCTHQHRQATAAAWKTKTNQTK